MTDEQIEAFAAAVVSTNPTVQCALDALIVAVTLADEMPAIYPKNIWRDDPKWLERHWIRTLLLNAEVYRQLHNQSLMIALGATDISPAKLHQILQQIDVPTNYE